MWAQNIVQSCFHQYCINLGVFTRVWFEVAKAEVKRVEHVVIALPWCKQNLPLSPRSKQEQKRLKFQNVVKILEYPLSSTSGGGGGKKNIKRK
jgi:hypothetical protein